MRSGKPLLYWDTSVLLAWIKDEPNEMEGVNDIAHGIHKNHYILLTSAITLTEVLESTLTDEARIKFNDLFKRKNCQMVAADLRITQLASQIRDYYQRQKSVDGLPSLSTPDAIHLATAIHYAVKEFHTFDEKDDPKKRRALIPLSGNVAGHPLVICKPPIPAQLDLFAQ
ncbi:MAG: PIN domain-containing protein [Pseudomonadota bacterium]|nr:PIN domain-containing protein [Pseudomonadota bacterium]